VNSGPALATRATAPDADESTRARVARAVGEDGPVTASELAVTLGLTPAAVRRHLDAMYADGLIDVRTPAVLQRRRGRPAKAFVLTDAGHAAMTNTYDDLAASALRFLADRHGRDAVRAFAAERVAGLEQRYAARVLGAGDATQQRAQALAGALSGDGYAATARPVGMGTPAFAVQLCQGHCPVQHVAAEFPELCEAEADAFSRLLGVHVQRLATLAQGAHVCTTHVPVGNIRATAPAAGSRTGATSTSEGTTRTAEKDTTSGRTS
jgi:predicted ArsR family transcriptional regulator